MKPYRWINKGTASNTSTLPKASAKVAAALALSVTAVPPAFADTYVQTNLVSDIPGLASITDPNLVNPWGISHTQTSPFWVSDQSTNVATLYSVSGSTTVTKNSLTVAIPTTGIGPQGPTGTVANTSANFGSARFIFANLNGTISAWQPALGTNAAITVPAIPGTVYTGLAINQAQSQLYAANTAQARIDVFNSSFQNISSTSTFQTPGSISSQNLVPFNVRDINGRVYVTYAPSGRIAQQNAALGAGAIAVFDETTGALLQTITDGHLAAPWGITLAPSSFGQFANDLLVGNFSFLNSFISVFDPSTATFLGIIPVLSGNGHGPGGLWSLDFGIGGNNGSPDTLYFTDGIDRETHGLFGAIQVVPLPSALPLFATGLGALGLLGWRRKQKLAA
jgi:uncharacterized protein (TIGR03118 family)